MPAPHASPPLISIVTPAFDVAPFVADAIASVRAQHLPDWEMVLVDDGSRDGTARAAEHAAEGDPRIRILRQVNAGVSAARNAGIAAARADTLLLLDADDWLAPDALRRLADALHAAPGAALAYGPWAVAAEAARPGDAPLTVKTAPLPAGDVLDQLLVRNLLVNGGHALIRRAALEAAGGFRRDLRYGEDWECWVRIALRGRFARVHGSAPLLFVRERAGSAYRRMARDTAAFTPAMEAIWDNPALAARLGPRLPRLRARAMAERDWVVGRELLRHGARAEGLARLGASVGAAPGLRRVALLAAAHLLPVLPTPLHGPFRRYAT